MRLPYPFPFWVIAEQKGNEVGRLLYHWLYSRTKSPLMTLLVPDIAYFCAVRGR